MVHHDNFTLPNADFHDASLWTPLGSVTQDVVDSAAQLPGPTMHERRGTIETELNGRSVSGRTVHSRSHDIVEPDVVSIVPPLDVPCQCHDVLDSRAQVSQLCPNITDEGVPSGRIKVYLVAENLKVRAQRGQWCSQLVRRICDQLTLGIKGYLKSCQHLIEGGRELADLVSSLDLNPAREVACVGDLLRGPAEATDRRQPRPCDERGEDTSERDPRDPNHSKRDPQPHE